MALPVKGDACFLLATVTIASMSPAWDTFIQNYAVVISLILGTIYIVERSSDSRVSLYAKLLFMELFMIIAIGAFILPATGKWATGLHWHALLTTLFIFNMIFLAAMRQWLIYNTQNQHRKDLETFRDFPKYQELAEEENKAHKEKITHLYNLFFYLICAIFLIAEIALIFLVWLFQ
jgi:hypothetical protein